MNSEIIPALQALRTFFKKNNNLIGKSNIRCLENILGLLDFRNTFKIGSHA